MIVLIATAWGSASGGVNSFNYGLACGLSKTRSSSILCAVTSCTADEQASARQHDIDLVQVEGDDRGRPTEQCGSAVIDWLTSRGLRAAVDVWVGHDLITGQAAIAAARDHGGQLALIHHADHLSYTNLAGGAGSDTAQKRLRQIALFERDEAELFGVGPWLTASVTTLGGRRATCLLPGFPDAGPNLAGPNDLQAILAGRFSDDTDALKRARLAVEAFGEAVRRAEDNIPALDRATLVVLGADGRDVDRGALEKLARKHARRHVNIVPAAFDPDPKAVLGWLRRSNLAMMPSAHEGFGLIGWEAIGAGVPLIIGRRTGLMSALETLVGGPAEGCVRVVDTDGRDRERAAFATEILRLARDVPKARASAEQLRTMLKAEFGCTWANTAETFLKSLRPAPHNNHHLALALGGLAPEPDWIRPPPINHFNDCVELSIDVGQGASSRSFEVIADLRFGEQDISADDIEAQVSVSRVKVQVTSEHGRIAGERLGDRADEAPGIEARAGGVWILSPPDGGRKLPNRALGFDTLCRIETPAGVPGHARVEVTAAKRDITCSVEAPKRKLAHTTKRVMEIFLKDAIVTSRSGHVVLSSAEIAEAPVAGRH